jgi:hypothetical protein
VTLANILTRTAQGNALIDKHVIAYFGGFTYDDACSVVDNKSSAYGSARMYFNTRFPKCVLRDKTGQKMHIVFIKEVGSAMSSYSLNAGI